MPGHPFIMIKKKHFEFRLDLQCSPRKYAMGLVARKPVSGVSDKASFRPVSSATKTS